MGLRSKKLVTASGLASRNGTSTACFKGSGHAVNLHVFSVGCPEIDRMVAFRDRLRTDAADRELYARTKRALARQVWKYTQNYADAKTAVVEEILSRTPR